MDKSFYIYKPEIMEVLGITSHTTLLKYKARYNLPIFRFGRGLRANRRQFFDRMAVVEKELKGDSHA